jgi:asparagine synthase (glutamine-hydrolysing)
MCGICGIFDFAGKPVDRGLLERMIGRIRHRGPDGEGYFVSGHVGLGSCRLSIIDLEGGAQPQSNEDESVHVIFNGEIYNYIELRQELIQNGHRFKSRSDTEIIVHAYEEWGADCTNRFNGMFAFALWDVDRGRLLLARDHLGVKPLYYAVLGKRLLFSSEIKALLMDPECPREVDIQSLSQLFTMRSVPSPRTLFRGIMKLPPAHRATVGMTGVQTERYWNWTPTIRTKVKEAELIEEYRALVEDAVRLQMRSDVPVGLFLSSGIDSCALLAIMSKLASRPVRTFTIGFEASGELDETKDARRMAAIFGADHSDMVLCSQDYQRHYGRHLSDLEEPVAHEAAAAFYFLASITSRTVKVALTGQGADEPWAGYGRYLGVKLSEVYSRLPCFLTKGLLAKIGERRVKNERWKRGFTALHERDVLSRLVNVYSFFSPCMKAQLFQPWIKEQVSCDGAEARQTLGRLQSEVQDLDALSQMLYIDSRTSLPDDLLMVADKTSMANSLEVRVPFLDYRLVEFAESLPANLKLRGFQGKYLHKKAVEKWLPRDAVYVKKKEFKTPIDKWLRTSMRPLIDDCLLSEGAAVNRYFDRSFMRELYDGHVHHQEQRQRHLHLLLSFELWHQQFIS